MGAGSEDSNTASSPMRSKSNDDKSVIIVGEDEDEDNDNNGSLTPPIPNKSKHAPLVTKDKHEKREERDRKDSEKSDKNKSAKKEPVSAKRGEWDMFAEQNDFDENFDVSIFI